jgi:hypothetical protein
MARLLLSVNDVMAATGLGRTTIFSLFNSGDLKAVKVGRRTFVRPDDLQSFVDGCEERDGVGPGAGDDQPPSDLCA